MKKIIILEREDRIKALKYIFWVSIPTEIQFYFANPEAISGYKKATAEEIQDIKDGKVVEYQGTYNYKPGDTATSIRSGLIAEYQSHSSRVIGSANKFDFYGKFWDGTVWS